MKTQGKYRKKENHLKGHSLAYWFRIFLLALLVFVGMTGLLFIRHMKAVLIEQKVEDMTTTLDIYVSEMDASFDSLQNYLYNSLSDLEALTRVETGGTQTQMAFAKIEISNILSDILNWDQRIDSLIFYSPNGPEPVMMETGLGQKLETRDYMQQALKAAIDQEIEDKTIRRNGYMTMNTGDGYYLLRFYKVKNSYVGMGIAAENILASLNESVNDYESLLYISDMEGHILASTDPMSENLGVENSGKIMEMDGTSWLLINKHSSNRDFYIGRMMPTDIIFEKIDNIRSFLIFMIVIFLAVAELVVFFIYRFVERPTNALIREMERIGKGNWDGKLGEGGLIREYCQLNTTFNQMIDEIKNLKIKNYETELQSQKVYLQYLQLQINPHFYLNALNIVYSLAQIGDFKTIQKMVMALVRYLRYHFQDVNTLVTVSEELSHVRSYIEIQQIRFSDSIIYEETMEPAISCGLIPPFIIQSFTENSIKYALKNHRKGRLRVNGEKIQTKDGPYLKLAIRDNGDGYSQEVIHLINDEKALSSKKDEKIGIRNVMERLDIIYGHKARIVLSNDDGAVTTVYIPLILKDIS